VAQLDSVFKIYVILNLVNEKFYIGRTRRSLLVRWKEHLHDAKKRGFHFSKALNKYGSGNFYMRTIDQTSDEARAYELETFYIKVFQSHDPRYGYNSTLGGDGAGVPNAATRAKMSVMRRGSKHPLWGTHRPESVKKRLSEFHTGSSSPVYRGDLRTDEIVRLYKEGKSLRHIGAIFNADSHTISDRLKAAGIERRPNWNKSHETIHIAMAMNWRNNKSLKKP